MVSNFLGKPEVFWVALGGLMNAGSVLIILLYTLYTRKMMKLAEETRRAEIIPLLSVKTTHFKHDLLPRTNEGQKDGHRQVLEITLQIRNVGKGPATDIFIWYKTVTRHFLFPRRLLLPHMKLEKQTGEASTVDHETRDLIQHESLEVRIRHIYDFLTPRTFLVLNCFDVADRRHQLHLLLFVDSDTPVCWTSNVTSFPKTRGEKIVNLTKSLVSILKRIDGEIEQLDNETSRKTP